MQLPLDLPKRLPLTSVPAGTVWVRIHLRGREALWFGPSSRVPLRFDDPLGQFRVCYLGPTLEVSFAKTFLRNPPVRILALDDLAERLVATVVLRRELRLVSLHGPGLVRMGTTTMLGSGSDYRLSQSWSRALWEHADRPDGLVWRPRHDDSALSVVIYDRAKGGLRVKGSGVLTEDSKLLAGLLKRYGLGLKL